jgi:tetratricopeptide (TPR) repeat protein
VTPSPRSPTSASPIWAYLFRSFASEKLRAVREAEEDFQNALELDPNENARYLLFLTRGILRFNQNDWARAEADFRSARDLKPQEYNAYVNLAWVYLAQGKLEKAELQAKRLLQLRPPPVVLLGYHVERGRLLSRLGRHPAALEACEAALQVDPEHPATQGVRARALLALGRYEDQHAAGAHHHLCGYLDYQPPPGIEQPGRHGWAPLGPRPLLLLLPGRQRLLQQRGAA